MPLQNNKCPDFECIDDSSCNDNGVCKNKECDCKNGFTGIDCAFDLKGEKLWFDIELLNDGSTLQLSQVLNENYSTAPRVPMGT